MENDKLFNQIKEMFPDAPVEFISAMYHNLKGKQIMWKMFDTMNDDSKTDTKKFGQTE